MKADFINTKMKEWFVGGMIFMTMSDGKEVRFPVELNRKLKNATDKQLNIIEIICGGSSPHWPDLDEDLSVTGIMEGKFAY